MADRNAVVLELISSLLLKAIEMSSHLRQAYVEKREINDAEWASINGVVDAARQKLIDALNQS